MEPWYKNSQEFVITNISFLVLTVIHLVIISHFPCLYFSVTHLLSSVQNPHSMRMIISSTLAYFIPFFSLKDEFTQAVMKVTVIRVLCLSEQLKDRAGDGVWSILSSTNCVKDRTSQHCCTMSCSFTTMEMFTLLQCESFRHTLSLYNKDSLTWKPDPEKEIAIFSYFSKVPNCLQKKLRFLFLFFKLKFIFIPCFQEEPSHSHFCFTSF